MQILSVKYWQTEFNSISKMIIHHDQVGFTPRMQRWFNTCKSLSVAQHINRSQDENEMIAEKTVNKIQCPFMMKEEHNAFNYDEPIASIILNGENLKTFPLKSGARQGHPLSLVLEFLARAKKETKRNRNRNKP
jgi:hypothetical protein